MEEDIMLFPLMSLFIMRHHTNVLGAAAVDYIQIGATVQRKMAAACAEAIFLTINREGTFPSPA